MLADKHKRCCFVLQMIIVLDILLYVPLIYDLSTGPVASTRCNMTVPLLSYCQIICYYSGRLACGGVSNEIHSRHMGIYRTDASLHSLYTAVSSSSQSQHDCFKIFILSLNTAVSSFSLSVSTKQSLFLS